MIDVSFAGVLAGIAVVAILAAADWYIWGMTYAGDFSNPTSVRPLRGAQILDRCLSRLERVNWAVLPWTALELPPVESAQKREGDGFKKVA